MFYSRRISLFCLVDVCCLVCSFWVGWVVGVDGFFDNDSDNVFVSVVLVLDVALFFSCLLFGGCGVCFSMESLILAQDERWRRA